jgi:hypothetical protein
VVVAVGDDQRLVTDHESQHVELVPPPEVVVGQGEQLSQRSRITDHRHPQRAGAEAAHRAVPFGELVEHRSRVGQDPPEQARLEPPWWSGKCRHGHVIVLVVMVDRSLERWWIVR